MRYVALLRGINVGGKNTLKMETLRVAMESLGFEGVKTYVNSGNVIFETLKDDDQKIAKKIHDDIQKHFGLDISVMVRTFGELNEIIKNNPFAGQFENPKDMHVFFLDGELLEDQKARLLSNNSENEMIAVRCREIYYLLCISIIDSVLGKGFIDRKLKVPATARNWRTVQKIAEM